MTAKKRFFSQNRILSGENIIFALKFQSHEKRKMRDIVAVGLVVGVWLLCLVGVECDAQGRASDGAVGETLREAV